MLRLICGMWISSFKKNVDFLIKFAEKSTFIRGKCDNDNDDDDDERLEGGEVCGNFILVCKSGINLIFKP